MQPVGGADGYQQPFNGRRNDLAEQHVVYPVGHHGADGGDRDVVDQEHDNGKDRQCKNAVGDNLVDLVAGGQLLLGLFAVAGFEQVGNHDIAFVGDDALDVIVKFLFCLLAQPFDLFQSSGAEFELLDCLLVSLKQLDRVPAQILRLAGALQEPCNPGQDIFQFVVKLQRLWRGSLALSQVQGSLGDLGAALALDGAGLDDLAAQRIGELFDVDPVAVLADHIHHVEGDDHWHADLQQLGGQVQVAFQVGSVDDVDHRVWVLVYQVVSGDNLLQCVGGEGIDARQVLNDSLLVGLEFTLFFLNGYARPVADILAASGQVVEHCRLSAVGVTSQRDFILHCPSSFLLQFKLVFANSSGLKTAPFCRRRLVRTFEN